MRIRRVWLLVFAVALAALVGPPAHAQPPAESSLGTYPVDDPIGMSGEQVEDVVRVDRHTSMDFRDVEFFELLSPHGSVSVTTDPKTVIGQALAKYAGRRVRITIAPVAVQEIHR